MPTLVLCTGFEFGTTAGLTTGSAGSKIIDAQPSGAVSIVTSATSAPHTGTYCMRMVKSAAGGYLWWTTDTLGSSKTFLAVQMWVKVESQSGDATLVGSETAAGVWVDFVRVAATGTVQAQYRDGGGVISSANSSNTVPTGTWFKFEWSHAVSGTTHTVQWSVDGVSQTDLVVGGRTATTITTLRFGTGFAQTITAAFDDVVASVTPGDYPLGDHKVIPLGVDPADTVTLSGTASNWRTFAGVTPTLTAWNATTARDAIDEVPPNLGSSQDGLTQVAIAASDYVEIPMTTYTLQSGETVSGLRMVACGWAASATATNLGFRSWNGSTETVLLAIAAGNITFNNTSTPGWCCKMCTLADFNTQSELDSLAFRVGFGTDANPDSGIQAIYAELAVQVAPLILTTSGFITEEIIGTSQLTASGVTATTAGVNSGEQFGISSLLVIFSSNGTESQELFGISVINNSYAISSLGITPEEYQGVSGITSNYTIQSTSTNVEENCGTPSITGQYSLTTVGILPEELGGVSAAQPGMFIGQLAGVGAEEVVGTLTAFSEQALLSAGITSGEVPGNNQVLPGGVITTAPGVPGTEGVGASSLTLSGNLSGVGSGEKFGVSSISGQYFATSAGITTEAAAGNSSLLPGVSGLQLTGLAGEEVIGLHTVSTGQSAASAGIASSEGCGNSQINPGAVTLLSVGTALEEFYGVGSVGLSTALSGAGIAGNESLGASAWSLTYELGYCSVHTEEIYGSSVLSGVFDASLHGPGTEETFGLASVSAPAALSGIGAGENVGLGVLTPGFVVINFISVYSEESFGVAVLLDTTTQVVFMTGIPSEEKSGRVTFHMLPVHGADHEVFDGLMPHLVYIQGVGRKDAYGKEYTTNQMMGPYRAYVADQMKFYVDAQGVQRQSSTVAYINTDGVYVLVTDKITLPPTFGSDTRKIAAVKNWSDEEGAIDSVEVLFQ